MKYKIMAAADGVVLLLFFLNLIYFARVEENRPEILLSLLFLIYMGFKCYSAQKERKEFEQERKCWLMENEKTEEKRTRVTCEEEVRMLQNQINPHFLYNTLDSIRGQALASGDARLADMVEALAAFFRYSISRHGNIVTLEDEIKNVKTYVQIQKFRFEDRFDLEIETDASETVMECLIPKLTLQPVIENAIFHGLELSLKPGKVYLHITETEERLLLYVIDNGVGMEKEELKELNASLGGGPAPAKAPEPGGSGEGNGLALRNVNERIHIYFGEPYGITIYSTKGCGTEVEIVLPVIKDEDFIQKFSQKGSQS